MEILTIAALGAAGFFAYKALNPTKPTADGKKDNGPGADCLSAADCKTLSDCAAKLLPTAKATDLPTLGKILSKANDLGCTDVAKQVQAAINSLSTTVIKTGSAGGPGSILTGGTGTGTGGYSLVKGMGSVSSASPGDVLIVGLRDPSNTKTYVVPLSYGGDAGASAGPASYNNTIAEVALNKAKAQPGFGAATAALGIFGVTLGAPSDLPNGATFTVSFVPSDVLAIVTAKQLSSDVGGEGYLPDTGTGVGAIALPTSPFGPKPKNGHKKGIWDRGLTGG